MVLSTPGGRNERVVYSGALIPQGVPRYFKGAKRPVITHAAVIGNVTFSRPTQLQVQVDLPPDKIREVKYTESGFPWMSVAGLEYSNELKCWVAQIRPGPRAAIQESEYIYVWRLALMACKATTIQSKSAGISRLGPHRQRLLSGLSRTSPSKSISRAMEGSSPRICFPLATTGVRKASWSGGANWSKATG